MAHLYTSNLFSCVDILLIYVNNILWYKVQGSLDDEIYVHVVLSGVMGFLMENVGLIYVGNWCVMICKIYYV